MKTGITMKGLLTSVVLVIMSAPAMASDSLNYKRLQRSGTDHIRGSQRVEYSDRRQMKREHRKRRDHSYDGDRHQSRRDHRYDRNRNHARHNRHYNKHRHNARHSNRHQRRAHGYHHRKHSYWRYPLSSYYLNFDSSPYYSFGFRYYDN